MGWPPDTELRGSASRRDLFHHAGYVHNAPALDDLGVREPPDLDAAHLELLAGGGHTEEVTGVHSLEHPILDHPVARRR